MNALSTLKTFNKTQLISAFFLSLLAVGVATAGTGGATEFGGVYTMIMGWAEGTLGKIIALTAFIVGLCMGVARQSAFAIVVGLVFALSVAYGPGIIDSTVTAALPIL